MICDLDEKLCFWCIVDGLVVSKLGVSFLDVLLLLWVGLV